jgi:hypothetical protein
VKARLPLPEMAELRITPELPEYPKLAEEVFLMLLDGKLKSHNDIIEFLKPYSPPEPVAPPPPVRRGRAKKVEGLLADGAKKAKRGRKPAVVGAQNLTEDKMAAENLDNIAENIGAAIGKAVKSAKTMLEPAADAVKDAGARAKKAVASAQKSARSATKKMTSKAKKVGGKKKPAKSAKKKSTAKAKTKKKK